MTALTTTIPAKEARVLIKEALIEGERAFYRESPYLGLYGREYGERSACILTKSTINAVMEAFKSAGVIDD